MVYCTLIFLFHCHPRHCDVGQPVQGEEHGRGEVLVGVHHQRQVVREERPLEEENKMKIQSKRVVISRIDPNSQDKPPVWQVVGEKINLQILDHA